jgi:hypothetical protein
MIKKILLPLFIFIAFGASAQLNNSWIDYSKTYYKFKIGADNICRIPQSAISAAGIGTTNADNFQLWRNGVQVRLFTSVTGAPLTATDYIEFFGEMNDGKPDATLYRTAGLQLADRYSLETDTAVYFLTINTAGGNLRYASGANPAPGAIPADAFFMRTIDVFYKDKLNRGYAVDYGAYVHSSAYDAGEGYTSNNISTNNSYTENVTGLNVYTAGPANSVSFKARYFGNTYGSQRKMNIKMGSNLISSTISSNLTSTDVNVNNLPISHLTNPATAITFENVNSFSGTVIDNVVIGSMSVTYPATFNFDNKKSFAFQLAASATGNFLLIDNFNYGTVAPILYDITEGKRYVGDITYAIGKVKFVLPASSIAQRKFILNNVETANTNSVNSVSIKNFINYNTTTTRGDFIIISHPSLYDNGSGTNYVEQYRVFRSTPSGGSYNARVYDINELTDQFAFGIKKHPAAVRDFVRYMDVQYPIKPKFIFLIGRGMTYQDKKLQESNPLADKLDLVTTFGWPASDVLLVSQPGRVLPITPVGRLGAVSGNEVGVYLQKVVEYESAQRTPSNRISDKAWMKNGLHIIGGRTTYESQSFKDYMDVYKAIYEDTLMGGKVETFLKTSSSTIQQSSTERITELFQEGLGYIGYFGHSSIGTFEFNLSDPAVFNNTTKYPFFNVSGCSAGNFFNFDAQRMSSINLSLSDSYIFTPGKGSIGFLADTHFGIPDNLNTFNERLFKNISLRMYGKSIGEQIKEATAFMGGDNVGLDYTNRIHLEEILLHGDPSIKIFNADKPDYAIEQQSVKINPSILSVADVSFDIEIAMRNIGRATNDSIRVSVKRLITNTNVSVTLKDTMIFAPKNADTLKLNVPINPATDKGENKIIVKLDWTNKVDELFENNNEVTNSFFIFENSLIPVYPYNYSIVNNQNITFNASTANPLAGNNSYTMEIDTTELFNSPFKKAYTKNGIGGVIEFTPTNLTLTDSTVYYWRTSVDNATPIWNTYSFVYLPASTEGFNMSHYYQFKRNKYTGIALNADRQFTYLPKSADYNVRSAIYPYAGQTADFQISNSGFVEQSGLSSPLETNINAVRFYVIDQLTLKPWFNQPVGAQGQYGSFLPAVVNGTQVPGFFQFDVSTPASRATIKSFLDIIPNGNTIIMVNGGVDGAMQLPPTWATDPSIGGLPNLYNTLKSTLGFNQIDQVTANVPFIFATVKGNTSALAQEIATAPAQKLNISFSIIGKQLTGTIVSDVFGPAKSWNALHWRGTKLEAANNDKTSMQVIGLDINGNETVLANVLQAQDTSLTWINATQYPKLKLKMFNQDSITGTPHQLRYWRINATLAPEGALAPNVLFNMKDTVEAGDSINFTVAFKNISKVNFSSAMKIALRIRTNNNFDSTIIIPNGKVLVAGDTLKIAYSIPSQNYIGKNTLFLDVNPNNDQLEQYHPNNILYKDFVVKADQENPLLDVTFDGIHILSRDIVSSRPNILIKLKDESKFLALKDTSLVKVQLRYPGEQNLRNYRFGGDTLRFTPANLSAGENTATINFNPYLPKDGEYELVVSGKDVSGNKAGDLNYRVAFKVINKPMISEMLNYPNPFTSSTAFVFTLTGTVVPQNLRIQILTITGKVVKEITKEDLKDIHIGRNITDYKWDGTDMYGQKLANGVYIYRVITNLNGEKLDKYRAENDDSGKYFNKGYGKMYLMR